MILIKLGLLLKGLFNEDCISRIRVPTLYFSISQSKLIAVTIARGFTTKKERKKKSTTKKTHKSPSTQNQTNQPTKKPQMPKKTQTSFNFSLFLITSLENDRQITD